MIDIKYNLWSSHKCQRKMVLHRYKSLRQLYWLWEKIDKQMREYWLKEAVPRTKNKY